MNLQDLGDGQKPRHLTKEMKVAFCELAREQLNDPVNKETDGMLLSTWVIALLENAHNNPEWFEEEPLSHVSIDEQLETPEGRAYIARRLLEACEEAGEIVPDRAFLSSSDEETADTIVRVVKSREFKRGFIKFKEQL